MLTPLQHNIFLNRIGLLPSMGGTSTLSTVLWLIDNGFMKRNFDQRSLKSEYKATIKGRLYLHKLRRSLAS